MPLAKIPFAPGINKEGTQLTSTPQYYDCDKMRFRKGKPEQIGGWVKYIQTPIVGVARSLFGWGTTSGQQYLGIGTSHKFYVENGAALNDITPIRNTTAAGEAKFGKLANGSATIVVTDVNHGAVQNDYVTFSLAAGLGGTITANVLNQEYQITDILDADNYHIEARDNVTGLPVLANSSDVSSNGGGANTIAKYQINSGTNAYVQAVGWGTGGWASGIWGGGGSLSFAGQLRLYSQDNFADDLLFCPRGGNIYYWDESAPAGTKGVPLSSRPGASNPPTVALQIMVSPLDKHVIAFGCDDLSNPGVADPLLVRWSDDETEADWTPSAINSAGGVVLSTGSIIIGAVKTRQEILIFTDVSVYSMNFTGDEFVFRFSPVAENVSLIGPKAAISKDDMVFFMDRIGFYVYRGAVQPIPCSVYTHVFSNLNFEQAHKIHASINPDNNEVTWHYPVGTGDTDITHYVTFNYIEEIWTIGTISRAAWIQAPTKRYPIASTNNVENHTTNYLYNQEYGNTADGGDIGGWIESGRFSISDGENFSFMKRFIPDLAIRGIANNARFVVDIKKADFSMDTPTIAASKTLLADTKQAHVRVRARDIVFKITSSGNNYGWTMGDFRFDIRTSGRR